VKLPGRKQHADITQAKRVTCLCCGFLTYFEGDEGHYFICPVCYWEDDRIDTPNPDEESVPNHMTLKEGRRKFRQLGAVEERLLKFVRAPNPDEIPEGLEELAQSLQRKMRARWKRQGEELNDIFNDWDFIGVEPYKDGPKDEYDCLIWPVISLLLGHGDAGNVAEYLSDRASDHFGLELNKADIRGVSKKIMAWWSEANAGIL
jgi:hypothetical protein